MEVFMSAIELTAYPGSILGPIARLLGWIMSGVYDIIYRLSGGTIQSVPLAIVIMTLLIYLCMLPLTIKQQKFAKLSQKMQPEIKAIQEKYKNRKDQESAMAMNQETQLIYEKYGISPTGSCLPMLIQMPILFALYRVFYNIPAYIGTVKDSYTGLVDGIMNSNGYLDKLTELVTNFKVVTSSGLNSTNIADKLGSATGDSLTNYVIDIVYKLPSTAWNDTADAGNTLIQQFPDLKDSIATTFSDMGHFNYFLGLNISDTPWNIIQTSFSSHSWLLVIVAALIPILAYVTQVINVKLMPTATTSDNDQMAMQMKTMNMMMPLMSLFFCFVTPVGLGIYWIASAAVRGVQQFFINRHIQNLDLDEIIAKNQEKAKKKKERLGISEDQIRQAAMIKTKSIESKANTSVSSAEKELELEKAESMKSNAKAGSLAAKANMVKEFNERNNRK
jgi:YidC/Oxa1 family membrane protein insertase